MKLPLNNRIRAEHIVPQEIVEHFHDPNGLVKEMNRQLTVRIADELLKHKPEVIEQSTVKHNDPYRPEYHRIAAEVFVFTKDELEDLIRKVQIETSIQIKEQMILADKATFKQNKL